MLEFTGGKYEFVIATHVDKDHIHNHIILNTTNTSTLKKSAGRRTRCSVWKQISDRYGFAGVKIIDKQWAKFVPQTVINESQAERSPRSRFKSV